MRPAPVIANVGHVALQVGDLDAAVEHATTIMGLRVARRGDDGVDLTHGSPRHSLQYLASDADAVDHVGLEAAGPEAVAEIRRRVDEAGLPVVSDGPLDDGLQDGLAFGTPDGFVFEVYAGMPQDQPAYVPAGVRPKRFGHVNFALRDPGPMIAVLTDVLDFRISDRFRGGAFLRCNAEHHGIGVLAGPDVLHHHAWEVESLAELGRMGDLLDEQGTNLLAGPIRHGIGRNIAAYFRGPGGIAVEYYTDMQRIFDESSYVPAEWSEDGYKWYTRWGTEVSGGEVRELGMAAAQVHIGGAHD